ncbi:MAG TPA: ABC transporter permease, partial [Candidatus Nitrosotenuis sp.]|nr:ABC transporter permease [Candidatus Nitrosotenuis sp.]
MNATEKTVIAPPRGLFHLDWAEIWAHRELLYFFVWRDLKVRYKQTLIGAAWAVLQPVATMAVFTLFFGRLAKMPSYGLPYPLFFFAALLPWTYFSTALNSATSVMIENQRVITKVYFPRVLLPLSSVVAGLVDFGISFVLLIAIMFYYGVLPGMNALLAPLFLLLAVATALGAGLWLSALNAIYRDVRYAIPFLIQFWMFGSPVIYPSAMVPAKWQWLYGLNPMSGVIEGFRWSLTGAGQPPGPMLAVSVLAVLVMLFSGLL